MLILRTRIQRIVFFSSSMNKISLHMSESLWFRNIIKKKAVCIVWECSLMNIYHIKQWHVPVVMEYIWIQTLCVLNKLMQLKQTSWRKYDINATIWCYILQIRKCIYNVQYIYTYVSYFEMRFIKKSPASIR